MHQSIYKLLQIDRIYVILFLLMWPSVYEITCSILSQILNYILIKFVYKFPASYDTKLL